ncbi:MAG TPA: hypothetical protein PLB05_02930 [Candidatus Omnitrophota bacterium]|nr:hypothetical protein [Candidatus Omnitrophota bacterium]
MRVIIILSVLIFSLSSPAWALSDAWAILQQTATQTAEHIKRLEEAIKQVELVKTQVELALEASRGFDGVDFISDFRNIVLETNDILSDLDGYITEISNISSEWKDIFGSLDNWVDNPKETFEYISMADDINSAGYRIADTFQDTYKRNAEYAQKFITHAKGLNEKGALKQIAEQLGHLMQMQNEVIYILSQSVKQQSIENSNQNSERKEDIIHQEQENSGVKRFIQSANRTFGM